MRKVIAGLIMACAIGFYVFHMMNVGSSKEIATDTKKEVKEKTEVQQKLDQYNEQLTNDYPSAPADVMVIYDELLKVAYSGMMTDEEAAEYVKTVRRMYSEGFNGLNPEETQLKNLLSELSYNKQREITIVASDIGQSYILTDDKDVETEASVTVTHATTVSGDTRKYLLIKENDLWKINGWESTQKNTTEE